MLLNLRFPEVLGTQNQDVKLLQQILSHWVIPSAPNILSLNKTTVKI